MRWVIVLLALVTSGCTQTARGESRVATERAHALAGVAINAPRDAGWASTKSDQTQMIFDRQDTRTATRISVRSFSVDPFVDDKAFLVSAEARQQEAVSNLQMVSIHFNHIRFKDASCLQYDGIFRDSLSSSPDREFLATMGYVCRHPANARRAVHMELSQRSASEALTEDARSAGQALFESAQFTRVGLER
jgi:hypothetical protein